MIIKVAGFNCDIESIEKGNLKDATCETIAASYARISRDPRPIWELRKDARENVKSARELNKRVVFDMGHSSIAEHAVFNLDIIGISRLAAEFLERFRLASYTEKSQRYIKLGEDFIVPEELPYALKNEYISFVKDSFSLYEEIYQKVLPLIEKRKKYGDEGLKKRDVEGLAMEDARYVLPLAVSTQLGLTANSRNIEYIIKILASSPIQELKSIANSIYEETIKYAPSLIRYTEPEEFFKKYWYSERAEIEENKTIENLKPPLNDGVQLISTYGDYNSILTTYLFSNSIKDYKSIYNEVKSLGEERKREIFNSIFQMLSKHNQLPRFFENIILEYELIMSASCYAQFKRHRMMTQIPQPFSFNLGFEIPPLVKESGFEDKIIEHLKRSSNLYHKIFQNNPYISEYVILNGHRRRVYALLNARELYHISRLRMDHHAQWEIRRLSTRMVELAKKNIDYVFDMCCGKDMFEEYKGRLDR
ncbi:MAG: FAD-dependent thymidylate synthase [Myxococcota bacterium]